MLDTLLVGAIVLVAAVYVGRRFYQQFFADTPVCNCSGCGNAGSCGSIKNSPTDSTYCSGK